MVKEDTRKVRFVWFDSETTEDQEVSRTKETDLLSGNKVGGTEDE